MLQVFEEQLPQAMNAQPFAQLLAIQSVKRIIQDSDGYQPFLVAPENGYRALVREGVKLMEQPAAMAVDAVDMVLRDIGQKVCCQCLLLFVFTIGIPNSNSISPKMAINTVWPAYITHYRDQHFHRLEYSNCNESVGTALAHEALCPLS